MQFKYGVSKVQGIEKFEQPLWPDRDSVRAQGTILRHRSARCEAPSAAAGEIMSARSPDEIDVQVGRNIRVRRLARRMTQTELAARLGIKFQQLQKYENGINRIGTGRLVRIADALDIPVVALLEGVDGAPGLGAASLVTLLADAQHLRLVEAFSRIEDRTVRHSLVVLVDQLARIIATQKTSHDDNAVSGAPDGPALT